MAYNISLIYFITHSRQIKGKAAAFQGKAGKKRIPKGNSPDRYPL